MLIKLSLVNKEFTATNRKAQLHQRCSGKGENEKLENYVGGVKERGSGRNLKLLKNGLKNMLNIFK